MAISFCLCDLFLNNLRSASLRRANQARTRGPSNPIKKQFFCASYSSFRLNFSLMPLRRPRHTWRVSNSTVPSSTSKRGVPYVRIKGPKYILIRVDLNLKDKKLYQTQLEAISTTIELMTSKHKSTLADVLRRRRWQLHSLCPLLLPEPRNRQMRLHIECFIALHPDLHKQKE